MEKAKTFSEYLERNPSSGKKEAGTRRKTKSFSEYQTYRDLSDGRLNDDLETLNRSLTDLDSGWKDARSLADTKDRLSGIVSRLSSAKQYGIDHDAGEEYLKSVDDAYKAYAEILENFGNVQDYYAQFASEEDYDKRVRRGKELYDGATGAEDFGEYSGIGAAIPNPSMKEAEGSVVLFGQRIGGKDIGNIVTYSIDNNKELRLGAANGSKLLGDLRYSNLKEDEISVYNYWLAKENAGQAEKGTAQAYLASLDDALNRREAGELSDRIEGNLGLELVFGFSTGLSQFANGVKNAFNFGDEYIAPSMEAYASQEVREGLSDRGGEFLGSSLGQIGYDTVSTIGNMFPTILLSAVTGGTAGSVLGVSAMGLSSAGNTYQELLNSGMNKGLARALSTVLGAWEGASEYYLGRIEGLSSGWTTKALGKTKLVKGLQSSANGLTRAMFRFFDQFVIDPAQEGLEEVIQDIGSTVIKAIFTGEWEWSTAEEQAYNFTLGALSAACMNAPTNIVGNAINDITTYRQGKNIMDLGGVDALKNLATETAKERGEASTLGQYAENVAKKPTPTNVGILDRKISEAKNENNRRGLEKALIDQMTKDGVGAKRAKREAAKFAEILLEDYNGGEVDLGRALKNPSVKAVYDKFVKNENSEIAKRDARHTEVREGIIRDYVDGKIAKAEMDKTLSEKYSFSDSGETVDIRTGEKITPAKDAPVASNKDGNLILNLENGETVRASDISFSSKGEAVLYSVIADMGVGADTANTLISSAIGADGKSRISVAFGLRDAYWYGAKGVSASELARGVFTSKLTEAARKTAYNLGKTDAIYTSSKKTVTANLKRNTYEGEYRIDDGKIADTKFKNLNDRQKSGLSLAKILSKLGANVYVFETTLQERQNGKENGSYLSADGSIHIDLNSGSVKGEGLVAYTVAHEFTHFIEDFSREKFKRYADLLFEELGKDKKSVSAMLTEEIERLRSQENAGNLGENALRDLAYSEVVAKCSEKIFTDTDALARIADRLAKTDRTLLQKIVDFFEIIIGRLRGDYKGQKANSALGEEAADTIRRVEAIRDIFADAAVDALKNYRSLKNERTARDPALAENGISVDAQTNSASLYSVRDVLDEKNKEKVVAALSERFGVSKAEAIGWLSAETSLASLILNPKYSQYLDYIGDPGEVAIKTNADYLQGTVDFSPICAKRREFTDVMNHVLRRFPNHVFESTDLAKIRKIMQEEGMRVPCGICYVEDRCQLDTVVAQNFIDSLKLYREGSKTRPDGKPFNALQLKSFGLIEKENYTPSVYELVSLEGLNILKHKKPAMASAWISFNNARGMQAVRLLANEAEYKRQILKYNQKTVKAKNDVGGLRIYSFSDAEMFHLIDIIQVITDSAAVGLSIQGYTKVNEYAKAVKDTGEKLNRSLIPKGELGYHMKENHVVLDFDTVEGIDIHSKDFFDNRDNPNIGNITIGVNDTQIRAAMTSDFIDQIIPFHTGQSGDVLREKGIDTWVNYKDFQTEKDVSTGRASAHQVNIYTEVLQVLEAEGVKVTKRSFVEKFLQVCKENGLIPRFSKFLNTDANGDFVYTEGYHKLLVDFKTFAQTEVGEYLPQMPVKPIFDNDYITGLLKEYATSQEAKKGVLKGNMSKVVSRISNEIVESKKSFSEKHSERYTYDSLVSKPDMKVTHIDENAVPKSRADIVFFAKKNAAKIGKERADGSVSVYVKDADRSVILSKSGLIHGLDRRLKQNAAVTVMAGEIIASSVVINELTPKYEKAIGSYVLIGVAQDTSGTIRIVESVVNRFNGDLISLDVLYSMNTKQEDKKRTAALDAPSVFHPNYRSTISIAQLLEYVNRYFPDIFPEDVLKHYGYDARPEGEIGKSALYSEREDLSNRTLLAGALETVAKNASEREKLRQYKTKIALMEQEENRLSSVKAKIKELSFSKGTRDTEKIRALQSTASEIETRITKYDRQLFRMEASEALRNVLTREVERTKRTEAKKYVEVMNKYRQKTAETVNEIVRQNRESRKNAIEGRNKTEARARVRKIVDELNTYLRENKVLIGMQKVVAEALDAVNMDTVGAEGRVAKYDELIAKTSDPAMIEELTATRNRIAAQGENLQGKLQKLKAAYADIINSDDPLIANSHDEVIEGKLDDVIREVGDTPIRNMTIAQLEAVYDLYKMILTSVRQANRAFRLDRAKTIDRYAAEVMGEIEKTRGARGKVSNASEFLRKNFGWDNLKPIYAMRMIGSDTLTELYKNVRDGQSVWYKDFSAARDFLREQKSKYGVSDWDFGGKHTFSSESGKSFDMTLEQILSLYAYSKRPQAIDHLTKGGIVFDDAVEVVEKNKLGIPVKYAVNDKSAYRLSAATIAEILHTLTEEQKAYADTMQKYLAEVMGEKGNEVSLALYGVKLFKEENYFPLKSSGQFLYSENEVRGEAKIKNAGFTKATVSHANNPIIMSNFTDVWVGHCNEMSMYHAFTLPLEDFNRVWQYKARGESEDTSVRTVLSNACGDAANTYIKDLLVELNGGVRVKDAGVLDKLTGLAKKGAVLASASVTIQQPSAICRAMAYISPKYFLKTALGQLNFRQHSATWEECKKYAPIAGIKEMGYFDTGMGRSSLEWAKAEEYDGFRNKLKAFFKDGAYRDEVLSKAPALADEITWCHIWNATKAWVSDTTSLVGEDLLSEAGKRFTEVIDLTQVYDSVLSRSANMRNKNSLMKMATAFMAEPTTTANMVLDAFVRGKRVGGAKGAKIVSGTVGAVTASIVLNSLLKAVVYAWRDDDDEKSYLEKYGESAVDSFLDDINPFNYIPVLKDIVSLFQGYDVSRLDMSLFEDLLRALRSIDSSRKSAYQKVADILGAISSFFGIPLRNIERDLRPLIKKIIEAFG